MLSLPTGKDCVVNMATPLFKATGPPRNAPSRSNVTSPVGVGVPSTTGATVAVKVTDAPTATEALDVPRAVMEATGFTVSLDADDTLPA